MKKIVSAVLVFVMMLSLAGCGISYDDIKGDWTAKTINGMTIDEYAASLGVDPNVRWLLLVIMMRQSLV